MSWMKKYRNLIFALIFACLMSFLTWYKHNSFLQHEYTVYLFGIEAVFLIATILVCIPCEKEKKPKWKAVFIILTLLFSAFFEACVIELLNNNMIWELDPPVNILMNVLINLILYIFVFTITGRYRFSLRFTNILLCVFGLINYYVKLYKGSPFLPWDLRSLQTAAAVAGTYSYQISAEVIAAVTITTFLCALPIHIKKKVSTKKETIVRVSTGAFALAFTLFFYCTDFFAVSEGATPDFFNQTRGYESKGALAEFIVNTKYLTLEKPEDYNPETLKEDILAHTDSSNSILKTVYQNQGDSVSDAERKAVENESVQNPNIIVIMNESFSDLHAIGDFETNEDYMPFIHSLAHKENVISGSSYVSTIGTGTSNTEYEFLTGNSMAFLPVGSNAYQLYVKNTLPSLVSTLHAQNYSADAFHPYYKDNWNRPAVYKNMGFDSYTAYEDMNGYHKLRSFVSDACDFELIQQMYEKHDPSEPFFLFNVTMQNHSSYDQTDNSWFQQIKLQNMQDTYPNTEQYLSLIKETDTAFQNLVSYFSQQKEPTIILMYGDHQPFIEDEFYEEVMGKKISELSDEENQKRYITKFVMWANYDIPEANIDQISVNYLSTLLAQVSGTKTTAYQNYLSSLYEKFPVITSMGCIDHNGNWFAANDAPDNYRAEINLYHSASYNNLIDTDHLVKPLFYLKETDND